MKNFITFFEIPVTDFNRAKDFYQKLLDITIEDVDMAGIQSGLFPNDGTNVSGALIKSEDYIPSSTGVTVYLDGGSDLQAILDKVKPNGGKIALPKTSMGPEMGFYAVFLDTEGNRMALMSQN